MKTYDRISSGFWLLISLAVFVESIRLGIGTLHNPGRGFLTFGASGLLGILALVLFVQASIRKEDVERVSLFGGKLWERIVFVLIALGLYSVFMPTLGYLISTFILMTLLYWVLEKKKIGWVFVSSFLSTVMTYLVFSKWLNCQFPEGFFGF
jgi:hypothetical protein